MHAMEAGKRVKEQGLDNNLIELICADPAFGLTEAEIRAHLDPAAYTGRSASQVEEFFGGIVKPILEENKDKIAGNAAIQV